MGFMDSLKKATGLGLNAGEHYDRAYEKGVLLGPANYPKAAELFETAAAKAAEAGDGSTQARAKANAALYNFIATGNEKALAALGEALPFLEEIEQIGARTENMSAALLLREVQARISENVLARIRESDHAARRQAHAACAEAFRTLSNAALITYKYQATDQHREQAFSRFFYHQGMASWHEAMASVPHNPETAGENMAKALNAFRQCGDPAAEHAQVWLSNCRSKRTCWICHREFQGATLHFRSFPALVTPYAESIVRQLGHDTSMLDAQNGTLTLCNPCGTVVENLADQFATKRVQELRTELEKALSSIAGALSSLADRVARLESVAHRH